MNKAELIEALAEATDTPKTQVNKFLNALTEIITDTLKSGDEITLVGVGKLDTNHKAARAGRNPLTGESIQIAARTAPRFKASKQLKDALN